MCLKKQWSRYSDKIVFCGIALIPFIAGTVIYYLDKLISDRLNAFIAFIAMYGVLLSWWNYYRTQKIKQGVLIFYPSYSNIVFTNQRLIYKLKFSNFGDFPILFTSIKVKIFSLSQDDGEILKPLKPSDDLKIIDEVFPDIDFTLNGNTKEPDILLFTSSNLTTDELLYNIYLCIDVVYKDIMLGSRKQERLYAKSEHILFNKIYQNNKYVQLYNISKDEKPIIDKVVNKSIKH